MATNSLYPTLQDLDLSDADSRFGVDVSMSLTGWTVTDRFVTLRVIDLGDGWEVVLHGTIFSPKTQARTPFFQALMDKPPSQTAERDSDNSALVALERVLDRVPSLFDSHPILVRMANQIATLADRGRQVPLVGAPLPEPGETVYLRDLTSFPEMHLHAHLFRDEVLVPTLVRQFNKGKVVAIDLTTDVYGIGTVFLREAFQEIPLFLGVSKEELLDNRIRIVGKRSSQLEGEIRDYVMNFNP